MSEVNYGPLKGLIGTWSGDKGVDVAPVPTGSEDIPYEETITFSPVGGVTNAGSQTLAVLHYHQSVRRSADGVVFHDQHGYFSWDADAGSVTHTLMIPRGVGLVAQGTASETDGAITIEVATADSGVAQSDFMRDKASTTGFSQQISINGDELQYNQLTSLEIYGKSFDHTDVNQLKRTA